MTLPSSGPLSLSDIQTEFGGSNPISLSEYYAGGAYVPSGTTGTYGAVPSSGQISIQNFYGTSAAIDTQTVTVGVYSQSVGSEDQYYYGYYTGIMGSVSDGTFNPKGGATVRALYNLYTIDFGTFVVTNTLYFQLAGSQTNAGWTNMIVDGVSYSRASATYFNSGAITEWGWTLASTSTRPFGTTAGATVPVTFT